MKQCTKGENKKVEYKKKINLDLFWKQVFSYMAHLFIESVTLELKSLIKN